MRKYLDEGKSRHTVLSVLARSLREEIKTYYQSFFDDDDYPLTAGIKLDKFGPIGRFTSKRNNRY